jgi:hypothetical protein
VASFSLTGGDTVKIYKGNTETTDALIATLTGNIPRLKSYDVASSQALVVFTSDASLNGDGFTFNYSSTKTSNNYCSSDERQQVITSKTGSIDNGNGTNYDSHNTCYWAISPERMGSQIKFAFSHFDLKPGDVIEIMTTSINLNPLPYSAWNVKTEKRFSSTENNTINSIPVLDSVYTVSGPIALIRFKTDNNLTATGFRIYWEENMSIQENNFGLAQLSICPNPVNDVLTVNLITEKEENVQITVYDILGKVMYSGSPMQILGQHEEYIDVSNFSQGFYLLRVKTSEGTVTKKIIKQ